MKILVTGANGQLGRCLADVLKDADAEFFFLDKTQMDLSKPDAVRSQLDKFRPDFVVNAAAYTAVDKAESEPELAQLINATSPEVMALWCHTNNAGFIHVSTDYVFDGSGSKPYRENDVVNPTSVYGRTKLAGEVAVLKVNPAAIIIRTAWVFSEYGHNFVKTMLRLGAQKNELKVVEDQIGCPTYAGDLATAIKIILARLQEGHIGIYHFCGDLSVSWYEFAREIIAIAKERNILNKEVTVTNISTCDYPTTALRPTYSVLDTSKINRVFDIKPSDWRKSLRNILEDKWVG
jgi:dTDP-4-dehydrorhamnose reductase